MPACIGSYGGPVSRGQLRDRLVVTTVQHSTVQPTCCCTMPLAVPPPAPPRPARATKARAGRGGAGGFFCVWCVDGKHDAVGCDGPRCPGLRARAARRGGERTGRARAGRRDGRRVAGGACKARAARPVPRRPPADPNAKYAPRSAAASPSFGSSGGPGRSGGHRRADTCTAPHVCRAESARPYGDFRLYCAQHVQMQPHPIRTQRHAGSLRATFAVGRRASRRWAMECGERGRHAQQTSCAAAAVAPSASDAEDLRTTIRCLPQCWCVVCTRVGCTAGGLGVHSWRQTCSAGGLEPRSIPSS